MKNTRKLSEISRPIFGLGGYPFNGSSADYTVAWNRKGDLVTESRYSALPDRPTRVYSRSTWSVSQAISQMAEMLKELNCEIIDDIPQGFSIVD